MNICLILTTIVLYISQMNYLIFFPTDAWCFLKLCSFCLNITSPFPIPDF